ncbi:NADH-quinone oxidoreductase subunit NuoN [Iodidimonas sp. SYSU 1G8]|uniref:NADH-quinone oxidoreductase subunit NuoN n=1 Tax=Iodidimonas sp. SYSU 1G8 TaxID=3133967 RepID=UPI0031FE7476
MIEVPALLPALPEIILAVGALALLMIGVFSNEKTSLRTVSLLAVLLLAGTAIAVIPGYETRSVTFAGMFVSDSFSSFCKILILAGSAISIIVSTDYLERENLRRFEYPVLIVLATLGMLMMVSANDLISLYMGIELQSLALYVLASMSRDSARSTEAGLKYFVLGALSSGMLLYGCSLIYGYTGATNFDLIAASVSSEGAVPMGLLIGLVFLIAGLAFKVSAVPFHMWTPDVYEGAPTPVTAFFAVAPKIAATALFVRTMFGAFPEISDQWQQILVFLSIASMAVGAVFAIMQTNIKRLMAYSSIGHVGYALMGLAAATPEGVTSVLVYLAIYLAMNVGTFALIIAMRRKDGATESIADLAGLSRTRPAMALALAVFMFSMAGIPPLAGFFGKFYVFIAAVDAGLIALAIIGALASAVSCYYYLRIIKVMYFDEPAPAFDVDTGMGIKVVASASALVTVLFAVPLLSASVVGAAGYAARSLFQ